MTKESQNKEEEDRETSEQTERDTFPISGPDSSTAFSPPHLPTQNKIETTEDVETTKIEKSKLVRGRKPLREHPNHILTFADLRAKYPEVAKAILSLCIYKVNDASPGMGFILRGRWGYFANNRFKKAVFREGEGIFLKIEEELSALEWAIVDNLHDEGMVFAAYDTLVEYLEKKQSPSGNG